MVIFCDEDLNYLNYLNYDNDDDYCQCSMTFTCLFGLQSLTISYSYSYYYICYYVLV